MILRAEAKKEAQVKEAEGEAEAILKIQKATAEGLKLLKEANVDESVLKLKSYEAFIEAANGKSTKIIIPSDLQSLTTVTTAVNELLDKDKNKTNKH